MKRLSKLRSRRGMTLTEVLMALAILAILTSAIVTGTNAAVRVYRNSIMLSESRTLVSTLAQGLSDELRYVQNIHSETPEGGETKIVFDSAVFGTGVSVNSDKGVIQVGAYNLVSERMYSRGLEAKTDVTYQDGVFTVEIKVSAPELPERTTEIKVRALNP